MGLLLPEQRGANLIDNMSKKSLVWLHFLKTGDQKVGTDTVKKVVSRFSVRRLRQLSCLALEALSVCSPVVPVLGSPVDTALFSEIV